MRITLAIFCFLYCCHVQAQNGNRSVFTLKPALGLNVCQIHGDSYSGYNKPGIFAGLGINAKLTERSSFEMGFYFSQKGARHIPRPDKGDYRLLRINLNYIDMPLSFRFMLNKSYFITLGASTAYLISYAEENEYGDYTNVWPFNKFELALTAGLGKELRPGLSVEVRFSNSILPVRNYGITGRIYYPNIVAQQFTGGLYNNIITIMFAYSVGQKIKSEPSP